ncbi:SDR family NAD(P)-dependent oxidoreductase [Streptomyces sp. NPDC020983]|uniref:SDR family NAD(P)-dependent oxidoreductase n=1 Tax=Streptomyces sp. NPDC020983 TaxID=3365106 RepID=UPI0037AF52D0
MKPSMPGDQVTDGSHDDAVAVIGLSCRVPSASNPAELWRLLSEGTDAVSPWPQDRGPGSPSWRGGFLADVGSFDAAFFGVRPEEAAAMDPQQRLALELAWEATEDAGVPADRLRGSRTGMFVGVASDDYTTLATRAGRPGGGDLDDFVGRHRAVVANRISWTLGLRGPSLAVDAAQASSLVAVHLACESIRRGECDLALAGGVSLILSPESMTATAGLGALSVRGRSAVFDESADGFVRGEGGGMVLLKPLARAVADGDPLYCVIRGSAVNNDGGGERLTDPDTEGQRDVLARAYADARTSPEAVQYVELHGTGTPVGDPVEAAALSAVVGRGADRPPLRVGSVKTNIGHLEAAAGIAGLLKAALSVRHRQLPPTLHFRTPHPAIPLDALNLRVQTALDVWPQPDAPLVAGVSSFGIGGTNCHVVLAEGPYTGRPDRPAARPATPRPLPWVISARTGRALDAQAARLLDHLRDSGDGAADIARSLAVTRSALDHRAVVIGTDRAELTARLGDLHTAAVTGVCAAGGRTAFLFAGGGAHRLGMGRELYAAHPVFARALDEVLAHFDPALGLREVLLVDDGADAAAALDGMRLMQPALFAFQVAMYRLVTSWGVEPDLLVGHSFGEIVAAHVSGSLSLADAAALAAARGELMEALPPGGAMIAVEATEEEAAEALRDTGDVSIGVINGPRSVVLSGADASVTRIAAAFHARGRRTTRLRVQNAAHSPLTEPMLGEFARRISGLTAAEPRIPIVSTVTGRAGTPMTESYWTAHVGATVRFHDAVTACRELGVTRFVELAPDSVLTPLVHPAETEVAVALQHRDVPEPEALLAGLGAAWVSGLSVDWAEAVGDARLVALPTYAFQRERYWLDELPAAPAAEQHISSTTLALRDTIRTSPDGFLQRWLAGHVAELVGDHPADPDTAFRDLGFDSALSVQLRNRLVSATGLRLPTSVLFDHPTPQALAAHLHDRITGALDTPGTADGPRTPAVPTGAGVDADPVVIVGMACRLPGGIDSPDGLWRAVSQGVDAVSEFPADRGWDLAGLYDPDPDHPGTSYARHGGFLTGAGDFDADFFGISPREAAAMDPQQRLLLETAWEALERSVIDPTSLRGSRTGVFVGAMNMEYGPHLHAPVDGTEGFRLTGNTTSVASGRISYLLGLEGPAMTVDTACSSSLVALHLAAQAVRSGECSLALAGGVTVLSTPGMFVEFSRQRGLAPDGRCKAFSDAADGTGWAEGVGVLVVERLSDAERNGHRVLAVVRGSAVNQDGASNGLTAPNGPSQQRVIRDALAGAGLGAADVDVVEAHGTGTALGDPIEAQALLATYGQERPEDRPLWLGSLKSNIGHTQAAAGVAGVIKMVEAMRHGVLPRTLHVEEPSRHVDWEQGQVRLLTENRSWPEVDRPRRSAVSSFGISGTNAHVILEAPPAGVTEEPAAEPPAQDRPAALVPWVLSARSGDGIRRQAARLLAHLDERPELDPHDVALSLVTGRARLECRAVAWGADGGALCSGLRDLAAGVESPGVVVGGVGVGGLVWVFPGQGSQWVGMARELLESSGVFAARLGECAAVMDGLTGWSLLDVVRGEGVGLDRVDVVQPVLFAVMVSLAAVWGSLGVRPAAVVGHSQGEIAAVCVAGGLSLEDAARVVVLRSRAIGVLAGRGGMVSVLAPAERVGEWLTGGLAVGVVNGPGQVVVSGVVDELDVFVERCEREGVQARRIAVDYASHSPQVEELKAELLEVLGGIEPRGSDVPLVSTVTGEVIDTAVMDAGYWFENLRRPVRFDKALSALLAGGHRAFVEVSPHPVLLGAVVQAAEAAGVEGVTAVGTLRRDEGGRDQLLRNAAELFTAGVDVDWSSWVSGGRLVDLPTYAFERRRFWLPAGRSPVDAAGLGLDPADHPLLHAAVPLASQDGWVLTGQLSLQDHPWLSDHAVHGTVILPGTAFVELALHAGGQAGCEVVEELTLERPLLLAEGAAVVVQVSVGAPDGSGRRSLTVHSRPHGSSEEWARHATGTLTPGHLAPQERLGAAWPPPGARRVDGPDSISGTYERLAGLGYGYGPVFRGLREVWRVGEELFAEVRLPVEPGGFGVHPALLDAALHPLLGDELRVPFAWSTVRLASVGASVLRVRLTPVADGVVRVAAFDGAGLPVVTVDGLRLHPMSQDQLREVAGQGAGGLFELRWTAVPVPETEVGEPSGVRVEEVAPGGDVRGRLGEVLAVVQDFLGGAPEDGRLVVVTHGGMAGVADPVTAAVWGLLRSAQAEHPGRVVVLDTPADADTASAVTAALATNEPQIVLEEGRFLVPRLAALTAGEDRAVSFASEGTVLVTGAGGVLAGHVVRHLVARHGVRHLLLVGRRGGERVERLVAEVSAAGVSARFVVCDVADRDAVAGVLDGVGAGRPLTGVVHTAGVLDDGVVTALTPERVDAVVAPKVDGARWLDELTRARGMRLSAFVVFSSAAGVVGTAGQGNYAAANAYLDALVRVRREDGLAGTSMAWGLWAETSAMTGHLGGADLARLARTGLAPISTEDGLALFDAALTSDRATVVPVRLDLPALRNRAAQGSLPAVFGSLVRLPLRQAAAPVAGESRSWTAGMAALGEAERSAALADLVGAQVSLVLGHGSGASVDPQRAFREMGFDSLTGLELRQRLQAVTGLRLPSTLVFDYPTLTALAAYLDEQVRGTSATSAVSPPSAVSFTETASDPVVIVGMACRLPGGIDSPGELWQAVVDGLDAVSEFPADRGWDLAGLYDPDPDHPGTSYARHGGFLTGAGDFDADFFGISPREAAAMDPQQRLLLETAWEALERSAIDPTSLRGTRTGVFTGLMYHDYGFTQGGTAEDVEGMLITGNSGGVASGRISYLLGLEGPAMTVDTACSSSLVALHLAAQALRSGECSLALAGGVTVMSTPTTFVEFSRQRAMSPDGRCKAFSDAADGAGWAEGVGLLVVERLSDAQRNGHQVLAVVRGSAVNQDGASNGLTAPNGPSQQRVIRDALAGAGLGAADVDAVEAHGTGTALGDPIEAQALLATYGQERSGSEPLWLGSVKSNIGHTQAAAGVAGVIKMVEAMRHGVLPRTLHVEEPSHHVDWEQGQVRLLTENRLWPEVDRPRRSAVSSFGIGGTNAHVILEAPPAEVTAEPAAEPPADSATPESAPAADPALVPWVLSARSVEGVRRQAARLLARLDDAPGLGLRDVGLTLASGRALLDHRAVVLGADGGALCSGLAALAAGEDCAGVVVGGVGAGGVVWVFPGQGSQWVGMARELLESSGVFAARLGECAAVMDGLTGWSLLDVVRGEGVGLDRVDVVQPVLFAVMVSLAAVWGSLGVRPAAVVGHSQGEIAAVCVAGGLSLEDAARVVVLRSRAIGVLAGRGGMVSVLAPAERVGEWLTGGLAVGVVNGPGQVVVSGVVDELDVFVERCEREGVQARRIAVDYASHSPQVEELRAELLDVLGGIEPRSSDVPLVSTVTGEVIDTAVMDAGYWFENLRRPVRFDKALSALLAGGHRAFVEVSPHPVLLGAVVQAAEAAGVEGVTAVGTLRRDEGGRDQLLRNAAELFTAGVDVDWSSWVSGGRLVDLPTFAFERRRFWLSAGRSPVDAAGLGLDPADHPLLHAAVPLADRGDIVLTGRISLDTQPWLADHAVFGAALLPGTAFVELALHAGGQAGCEVVEELTLERPLLLAEGAAVVVQVSVGAPDASGRRSLTVHSRPHDAGSDWVRHAAGVVAPGTSLPQERLDIAWPPSGAQPVPGAEVYERLAGLGYGYGPVFRGLREMWRVGEELFAEVRLPVEPGGFGVHPALLDAALHPLPTDDLRVPFSWSGVRLHAVGATVLRVRLTPGADGVVRVAAFDGAGRPVVTVDELRIHPMSQDQLRQVAAGRTNGLYELRWTAAPVPEAMPGRDMSGVRVEEVAPGGDVRGRLGEVLAVVQDFLGGAPEDGRLVVVTHGGMAGVADPVTAAVWGLLRSAQAEHPGRVVVLDTPADADVPSAVTAALATNEPQVVLHDGQFLVPRLAVSPVEDEGRAVSFASEGTVLVTGAGGVLAGHVVRHLVARHGVRHLLLVGRRGGERVERLVAEVSAAGVSARFVVCDVADRDAVAGVLDGVGAGRPLTGVVHTAGVLDDGVVTALTPERVDAVVAPKVDGARWLDELTRARGMRLSAFVVFSSAAGVVGTAGQGNYAAANAYLDALVRVRRADGLAGTSMAWGLWAETSAMTGHLGGADLARLARTGLAPISTEDGLALFDAALTSDRAALVTALLDLPALRNRAAQDSLPPLFSSLVRTPVRRPVAEAGGAGAPSWLADMAALGEAERSAALADLVGAQVSLVLGHGSGASVDPQRAFREMGFDSLTGLELRQRLQAVTGLRLPSTLVFDYPTLTALSGFLDEQIRGTSAVPAVPQPPTGAGVDADPVVIVGMACRLPGGIDSPGELWQAVVDGLDAVSEFPADRGWDLAGLYDPDPDHPGTSYARHGGFLTGAGDFDADFFGISPREAAAMDPQQRLLLETAWEALERSAIDPTSLRGTRTGVFTGLMAGEYGPPLHEPVDGMEGFRMLGNASSVASGRISYLLGLEGPAMTVDTACSSSLVALHLAAQALRNGECSLALAGGVTVMSTPTTFVEFSRQRAMSPDGRCKAFSDAADGAGWAEGVGLLVVERLSDARRNGHQVLAVVRGSAVNQDGASNGLTAPNGPSQQRVIRDALAGAGLNGADVDAVEAHGTGTALGDPIEAQALLATYGRQRPEDRPLWLGSVKSNIGHTQAAAGVAGIIKMIEAMRHGVLPRTLHADEPTHHVDWEQGQVRLLTENRPWPDVDRPRRSAVSSFGISGTNAHVILEAPPAEVTEEPAAEPPAPDRPAPLTPWVLSARTRDGVRRQAVRLLAHLDAHPGLDAADIGLTLASGRALLDHRAVVLGADRDATVSALAAVAAGEDTPDAVLGAVGAAGTGGSALVFSGQGAQRAGAGRELYERYPVFAGTFDAVCAAVDAHLDGYVEHPLRDVAFAPAGSPLAALLDQSVYTQTALFALETALWELLRSWGVAPDYVMGHSLGEITAACAAGVLSLPDACALVAARGRLMQALPEGGGMVAVEADEQEVGSHLEAAGLTEAAGIAAVNGPRAVVVSGDDSAVTAVAGHFRSAGRRVRRLPVSHAFHSYRTEPMLAEFAEVLSGLAFEPPHIPVVSNLTGEVADPAQLCTPAYWVEHVRRAVRFADGVRCLAGRGVTTFLEVGPAAVLTPMAHATLDSVLPDGRYAAVATLTPGRPEAQALAGALALPFTSGLPVAWERTLPGGRRVELPGYPFARQRYWQAADETVTGLRAAGLSASRHPLLGAAVHLPDGQTVLTGRLLPGAQPWLADHAVDGTPLLPGTAFLELALHAGAETGCPVVEELTLHTPLALPSGAAVYFRAVVGAADEEGRRTVALYSTDSPSAPADAGASVRHATGVLSPAAPQPPAEWTWPPVGATPVPLDGFYAGLAGRGYDYGPAFRGLRAAWRTADELYAEVELPVEPGGFGLHPALLDAALHTVTLGLPELAGSGADRPLLPFSWSGVTLEATRASVLRVRLAATGDGAVSLSAADTAGRPVVTVDALALRPMAAGTAAERDAGLHLRWRPLPAAGGATPPADLAVLPVEPGGDPRTRLAEVLESVQRFLAGPAPDGARLAVVTRGTLMDRPDPVSAAVWGMLRSAQAEHPGRLLLVDVDSRSDEALATAAATAEPQVAVRGGRAFAPRLTRTAPAVLPLPDAPGWRLRTEGPGAPEPVAVPDPDGPLGAGEVRVSLRAAAAGPGHPAGAGTAWAAAGVVVETGAAVTSPAVGDRVFGMLPEGGSPGRFAVTDHRDLAPVPDGWSFAQAAAAAPAFLTAWHALADLARTGPGDQVLVHGAGTAVGLAAVQVASHLGAEVYATAPSGARDVLESLGLDAAHLAEPEADAFPKTLPAGIDVILDPVGADTAEASAALLATGGRYLAVAGRYEAPGGAACPDSAPVGVADAGPARQREILAGLAALLPAGALPPPVRALDVRAAAGGGLPAEPSGTAPGLEAAEVLTFPRPLDPDGTVVVTGASGTLAQHVVRRLVGEHGVRHLLLLSRSGAGLPEDLRDGRVTALAVACDVGDRDALARALARVPAGHPPTAVVHTAGVLDDGVLEALTPERLGTVLRPKADAIRHLDELTADADLAAFVVFSSAAGVLGSPGQANYAAANAYLDAFATRRHGEGRPAVSLAWGMWSEASGMTSGLGDADRGRIARSGLLPTGTEEGLAAFDRALTSAVPFLVPARVDTAALRTPDAPVLLRDLAPAPSRRAAAGAAPAASEPLRDRLLELPAERRREALLDILRAEAAEVLGYGDPRRIPEDGAFRDLGFDSLTAVELRNRVSARTGLRLSSTAVFDHPSPGALVDHLLEGIAPRPAEKGGGEPTYEQVMADLTRLRGHMSALNLTGAQRTALAETVRSMSVPWTAPASPAQAEENPPADLGSASAAEVLAFVTNSLGISVSGDEPPTDPS